MSGEVITYYTSNKPIYFVIYDVNGLFWTGATFEDRNSADWASYIHSLTETVTPGVYHGDFPSVIGAGLYYIAGYIKLGISPSSTDKLVRLGMMDWTGRAEYSGGLSQGSNAAVQYSVGTGILGAVEILPGSDASQGVGAIITGESDRPGPTIQTGLSSSKVITISTGVN